MLRIVAVVLAGLATGVVTQLGQGLLPDGWSQAPNAISPWVLVAFLVGSAIESRPTAVVAGIATLVLALVGYYAMTELRFGIGGGTNALVFWGLGALVGGPVFGLAGYAWRTSPERRYRAAALGLLAAAFIAEGGYHAVVLSEPPVGVGFAIAGLLVPRVLGRSRQDRIGGTSPRRPAWSSAPPVSPRPSGCMTPWRSWGSDRQAWHACGAPTSRSSRRGSGPARTPRRFRGPSG